MAEESKKEIFEAQGRVIPIASDPVEADSESLEACTNCNAAIVSRKAGAVDHCHYCGEVLRKNN
jgi:ribosomal protein L37AE/L43A